jgi:signal transduction histidine kinase
VQLENALANRVGFGAAALVAVILAAAFLLLDRSLRRPVIYLTKAARSLNAGKLLLIEPRGPAELREIAGVFNGLVARVQQQRDSQLRFLAGIAHDLRTPLHAIGLSAECMDGENLDADQRETLRAVKGQVEQLDHQVSDLLDTTRIESGQLALRPSRQNVIQLVENTVKLFGGTSERHNVTLHAPAQPLVCVCDPTRITQVLNNLISNAIKYSPVGGDVVTSVTEDECHINIEVRDEGMGISPEDLPHIFEPFRRTASTRETIPGVGLGLSVAKRLVEAHGGTIEVASTRGTGTTFTVRLPRAPAETGKKVNGEK